MNISFVIPAYNASRTIERCIRSVLEQTDNAWEIIVIDDGSLDNTSEICESFANEYVNIKFIHQVNLGVSCARNRGIREARGDYICFLDADDWIEKESVSTLKNECNNEDILFFGHFILSNDKIKTALYAKTDVIFIKTDFEELQKMLLNRYLNLNNAALGQPWGKIYRRKLIEENLLYFPEGIQLSEDLVFNLYAFEAAQTGKFISKPLYNYVIDNNSATKKYRDSTVEIFREQLSLVIDFLIKNSRYEQLKDELNVRIMMSFMYCVQLELCHVDNKQQYKVRKEHFEIVQRDELFQNACRDINLKKFPLTQRIVCIFIRRKYFRLLDFFSKMFQYFYRK